MRRAFSYIRFSTWLQASGDSLRRQMALTQAYCERKGLLLDTSLDLHDLGIPAFRGENAQVGALAAFLEAVRMGKIPSGSVLIVESLDRLSRSQVDQAFELFRNILKAGICITTLVPEREYTLASINDIVGLLEPLFIMSRAHEESAMKSARVREVWKKKRAELSQKAATPICPAWLRLKEDGTGFELIPDAVKAVLRVYELARDGYSGRLIVERLRREGVPHIAPRCDGWRRSYVAHLLNTRGVLGEFQPRARKDGKKVRCGEVVPNYYPPIMTEAEWLATRRAVELRLNQRGPRGKRTPNLFTEMIFDARDGCPMVLKNPGNRCHHTYLASRGPVTGENDGLYTSFYYEAIEGWILKFLDTELATDLVRQKRGGKAAQIATLTNELTSLDHRIQAAKKRAATAPSFDALLDVLQDLEEKKKAASEELERLNQEETCNHAETLGEARSIRVIMSKATPEEMADLRTRLKARIRSLIKEIWVLIEGERKEKWATVQLFFASGKTLRFTGWQTDSAGPNYAVGPTENRLKPEDDLRQWRYLTDKPTFIPSKGEGGIAVGGELEDHVEKPSKANRSQRR